MLTEFKSGVYTFSKNLGTTFRFETFEGLHEANSIVRIQECVVAYEPDCNLALSARYNTFLCKAINCSDGVDSIRRHHTN
jgi:hypothetical protein